MSTPPMPLVPMFAPDGTLGDVPYDKMHDALQAGGKLGVHMKAPDGSMGIIPADRVADAQKAGGVAVPYDFNSADGGKRGFWGQLGDKISGITSEDAKNAAETMMLTAISPGLAGAKAAEATIPEMVRQATRPLPANMPGPQSTYRAATVLSPLVPGLNPEAMEKASGKGDTGAVAAEAAVPTAITGAAVAAPRVASAVSDALPSTGRAGAALGQVKAVAGDVPIDMTKPGNSALELYTQSQRGATLPKVVRDFVMRATKPGSDPITYAEAKDFQSNVSALSADERMAMKPNTQRLLGQLNSDLKDSLTQAADVKGKGQQFQQAMKEYHNAMTINEFTDSAKADALKYAVGAALGALGVGAVKKIWDKMAP